MTSSHSQRYKTGAGWQGFDANLAYAPSNENSGCTSSSLNPTSIYSVVVTESHRHIQPVQEDLVGVPHPVGSCHCFLFFADVRNYDDVITTTKARGTFTPRRT